MTSGSAPQVPCLLTPSLSEPFLGPRNHRFRHCQGLAVLLLGHGLPSSRVS